MIKRDEKKADEHLFVGDKVVLRDKRAEDAWKEYLWRVDPELSELDATFPLNIPFESFKAFYLEDLTYDQRGSYRFAIDTLDGLHIGNCMYYDLNMRKGEAELGILIGDKDHWNGGYGTDAVQLLLLHMFRDLSLRRVYLKTLDWNVRAQKSFMKSGFVQYGRSNRSRWNFILMDITRERWQALHPDVDLGPERPRSLFP